MCRLPPVIRKSSSGRTTRKASSKVITVKAIRRRNERFHVAAYSGLDLSVFSIPVLKDFDAIPQYDLNEIGVTGQVIGMGKFGNVVEGKSSNGLPLALKLFDLRVTDAFRAFVREQVAYKKLETLQGYCIPILYAVGRVPHCNVVYLALSDEGSCDLGSSRRTRTVRANVLQALEKIHRLGVVHNDIKLSHVLLHNGIPKFIDFEGSRVESSTEKVNVEEFSSERQYIEELLEVSA
jgi:RIO-like serine/threonine protein kinase